MQKLDTTEVVDTIVRSTPPMTVSFLHFNSITLSDTVYILTIVYIAFQVIVLFPKVLKTLKGKWKEND